MSKHLFICRHAETSPPGAGQPDFDRPLTPNGILDAQKAAHWILNTGIAVPAIMCSAAARTLATARIFASILQLPETVILPDVSIYHASVRELENRISLLPATQQVALLVGHNPAVSEWVGKLNSRPAQYVPTAAVNLFTFATDDWVEIEWSDFKWQSNF
jgi:phosphohistidine phosphatase